MCERTEAVVPCFSRGNSDIGPSLLLQLLFIAGKNCIASDGDYVEKQRFAAANLVYRTVLLCSSLLLRSLWK